MVCVSCNRPKGKPNWIQNPNDGRARRNRRANKMLVHLKKAKARIQLLKQDCTCKKMIGGVGNNGGTNPTSTASPKTSAGLATTGGATTSTNQPSAALSNELCGNLNPNESRVCIHARTKILGLMLRVKIEISKTLAKLDAEGSLFGTFLQATFGVHIALKKPRSFRCFGSMAMDSKEEVLNRVKKKLKETADNANRRFDAANAKLEKCKKNGVSKIAKKQKAVDAKRKIFQDKSAAIRSKKTILQQKQAAVKAKRGELDRLCKIKCCSKSCVPKRVKRGKCKIANGLCKIVRSPFELAIGVVRSSLYTDCSALCHLLYQPMLQILGSVPPVVATLLQIVRHLK